MDAINSAPAQQQAASAVELDARFTALVVQRDRALADSVMLSGTIAMAHEEIRRLQQEVARLQADAAKAEGATAQA